MGMSLQMPTEAARAQSSPIAKKTMAISQANLERIYNIRNTLKEMDTRSIRHLVESS